MHVNKYLLNYYDYYYYYYYYSIIFMLNIYNDVPEQTTTYASDVNNTAAIL
jgi:hypothetical protein